MKAAAVTSLSVKRERSNRAAIAATAALLPQRETLIRYEPPAPMSADEFNAAMKELGFTQTQLATYLGLVRNTVSVWSRGAGPVPSVAAAYLHLARAAKEHGVEFEGSPGPWGIARRERAKGAVAARLAATR